MTRSQCHWACDSYGVMKKDARPRAGAPEFERVRGWLAYAFAGQKVNDVLVAGVVDEISNRASGMRYRPELLGLKPVLSDPPKQVFSVPTSDVSYYVVEVTHRRVTRAGQHMFTASAPMVRFQLVERPANKDVILETALGQVWASDIRIWSMPILRECLGDLHYKPARVDVWTSPRVNGARFGAMVFMVVRDKLGLAQTFVLGGMMSSGKPQVMHTWKRSQDMEQRAGSQASPFTSPDHVYQARVKMIRDDPASVEICVRSPGDDIELQICAAFNRLDRPQYRSPYSMYAEVAYRAAAIAHARGETVPALGELTAQVAEVARRIYGWRDIPRSVAPNTMDPSA